MSKLNRKFLRKMILNEIMQLNEREVSGLPADPPPTDFKRVVEMQNAGLKLLCEKAVCKGANSHMKIMD